MTQQRNKTITNVTLNKLGSGYRSSNALNNDLVLIEEGFERTLDRFGGPGNEMMSPLDMNSQRIINLPAPLEPKDPIRVMDITPELIAELGSVVLDLKANTDASNISPAIWRTKLGVSTSQELADPLGAGLVGYSVQEIYGTGTVGERLALEIWVEDFGGDLRATLAHVVANNLVGDIRYKNTINVGPGPDIVLPRYVSLVGPATISDPGNPAFGGRTGGYEALVAAPKIILDPAVSIVCRGSNGLISCLVTRAGLALDGSDLADNYAGTAFKINNTDAVAFENTTILGFATAVTQTGSARCRYVKLFVDCNNGVSVTNSYDKDLFDTVHCYNVLQSGVDGNDPRTLRSGMALSYSGTFNGGPTIRDFFSYGYERGVQAECPGSYTLDSVWIDGPSNIANGFPLSPTSIGINLTSTGAANAEPQLSNIKITNMSSALEVPAGSYGTIQVTNLIIWGVYNGVTLGSDRAILNNVAIRGYKGVAIVFQNPSAANTATLSNVALYDGAGGVAEVECAGGDPEGIELIRNFTGDLRILNRLPFTIAYTDGQGITIPNGRTKVRLTGTGVLGDILPKYDGRSLEITFMDTGTIWWTGPHGETTLYDGDGTTTGNFKTASAFKSKAYSTLRLTRNETLGRWVETARTLFT